MTPGVKLLLAATIAVFLAQSLLPTAASEELTKVFGLSFAGVLGGKLWQPITYIFLHANMMHILFNLIGLFFFGPELERALGTRRFIRLYFGCGIVGGLGWMLISGAGEIPCIGASGAIFGVLGAFAGLFPAKPVTLLLFFVLPITIRARTLALLLGGIEFYSLMTNPDNNIAYAAHLAGGLFGYLYARSVVKRGFGGWSLNPRKWINDLSWHWRRRKFKVMDHPLHGEFYEQPQPVSEEEINAVLDKIRARGMASLTDEDREILARAARKR